MLRNVIKVMCPDNILIPRALRSTTIVETMYVGLEVPAQHVRVAIDCIKKLY